jgi:hypothetical protein
VLSLWIWLIFILLNCSDKDKFQFLDHSRNHKFSKKWAEVWNGAAEFACWTWLSILFGNWNEKTDNLIMTTFANYSFFNYLTSSWGTGPANRQTKYVVFLGYKSETHYRLEQPKEILQIYIFFKTNLRKYAHCKKILYFVCWRTFLDSLKVCLSIQKR